MVRDATPRNTSLSLVVEIDSIGTHPGALTSVKPFNVEVVSLPQLLTPRAGDAFYINATLEPLDRGARFPLDPDRRTYHLTKCLSAQAFIEGDSIVPAQPRKSLSSFFAARREAIVHRLAATSLSDDAFALLSALLVGARDDLSPAMSQSFRLSGAAHALALSGFHLAVIVLLIEIIMFPLRAFPRTRRLRALVSVGLVWLYALLTGLPLSIVRAAVMLSIFAVARIIGRRSRPLNSLCVAVLIILAVSPFSLFSVGLQLSVCAVAGIIAFSSILNPFPPERRIARRCAMYVTVPFGAVLGTLPVMVYNFHVFPLLFALSSFIITLAMPVVMISGILLLLVGNSEALASGINFLVNLLAWCMDTLASLPGGSVTLYPTMWQCIIAAFAIIVLAIGLNSDSRRSAIISLAICVAAVAALPAMKRHVPQDEWFVMNLHGSTPVAVRHGNTMIVAPNCRPRHLVTTSRHIRNALEAYTGACGVDTLTITSSDYTLGPFSRRGNLFCCGDISLALLTGRPAPDTVDRPRVRYALIQSQWRGKTEEIADAVLADTLLLGRDLSLTRTSALKSDATIPAIDLRTERWQLPPVYRFLK